MSKDCNLRIKFEYEKINRVDEKTGIVTNFEKKIGMLYRTFTEMNLW